MRIDLNNRMAGAWMVGHFRKQPKAPKVLRVIKGRLRLAGDRTGRKTKAYLAQFEKAVKLNGDTPVTLIRTDVYERMADLALLGECYGA